MSILKNALLGWLLIGGMVLYALTLTAVTTSRRVVALFEPTGGDDGITAAQS